MKYNVTAVVLLLISAILFQNCGKDDPAAPSFISIEDFIAQNNISPEYTASGLGYVINTTGGSRLAGDSSTVKTSVTVKTTDNTLRIDTQGDIYFNLVDQIPGLVEGMKLIGAGGSITLYVPYEIGWGATGNGSVPATADVIIDINMTDVLPNIETYLAENSIMISDTTVTGVYVLIEEEGDGSFPDMNSTVNVKYSGYYSNGDVFDSSTAGIEISLTQVIQGWTEGIPKFSKGGKGKLFIPYEAAYDDDGSGSIPGFTDIIFDIELVDFQ